MIMASDYYFPNDLDLVFKLEGEAPPLCHGLKERIMVSPMICTAPVQRMLLMQEVLVELSENMGEYVPEEK